MSEPTAKTAEDLWRAVSFLTTLGHASAPDEKTMRWFPFVGGGMGVTLGLIRSFVGRRSGAATTGVVVALADVAMTGALHLDGLADSADGLFAHAAPSSRLEIMGDPRVGTFGVVALVLALSARAAALTRERPSTAGLGAVYALSRSAMVITTRVLPYAREEGLVSPFLAADGSFDQAGSIASASAIAALLILWRTEGRRGLVAGLGACVSAASLAAAAKRRVGGFTGDVLGAIAVVIEITALLLLARP